jgi:hypothetical protein
LRVRASKIAASFAILYAPCLSFATSQDYGQSLQVADERRYLVMEVLGALTAHLAVIGHETALVPRSCSNRLYVRCTTAWPVSWRCRHHDAGVERSL